MRTAKVFIAGNSQAVRLPKEFRVAADEVVIRKSGDVILLIPKRRGQWKNLKESLTMFKGDLERRQPRGQQRRKWPWK